MNFREYKTTSGKKVLLGKNADNNEELISQVDKEEFVLHTKMPGSPFANIKSKKEEVTKEDLREAGIFCAKHSQDWRDNKKDIVVHIFLGKDISKNAKMEKGTFAVKNFKEINIKKEEIIKFENEKKI